jgi:hypothetical protein
VVTRRIAVVGVSGNGKTTFARRLAASLDVPYTELDALCHLPGWVEASDEDFRREVEAVINRSDGWVLDGSYQSKLGDLVLQRADTIVWRSAGSRHSRSCGCGRPARSSVGYGARHEPSLDWQDTAIRVPGMGAPGIEPGPLSCEPGAGS